MHRLLSKSANFITLKWILKFFTILVIYSCGMLSILLVPIDNISSFKQSLLHKFHIVSTRAQYLSEFETTSYNFSLVNGYTESGVFQLAKKKRE